MKSLPSTVWWELTRRCNLNCPTCQEDCHPSFGTTEHQELSLEEARFVIDELTYLDKALTVVISGGEPMLREDIFDIIAYAAEGGFRTVMQTNGTLLTEKNLEYLKEAGLRGIKVTIDSTDKQLHDSFRGLPGTWDLAVSALQKAIELGFETEMDVTIRKDNIHEVQQLLQLAIQMQVKRINYLFLKCEGGIVTSELDASAALDLAKKIAYLQKQTLPIKIHAYCIPFINRFIEKKDTDAMAKVKGCPAGRHTMRLTPEGIVTPCPFLYIKAGDLRRNSLVDIWKNAEIMIKLRSQHYRGRCDRCNYKDVCGGCRARALDKLGDFMAEDPLCDYIPTSAKAEHLKHYENKNYKDIV